MMNELDETNVLSQAAKAVKDLEAKATTPVQILEQLGPLLTDKSVQKRKLGLSYLSNILLGVDKNFLDAPECTLFGDFYKDRMNDHHSLVPDIIVGLSGLCHMSGFQGEPLSSTVRSFFTAIHAQSQVVGDRSRIFALLSTLLSDKIDSLVPMGSEFVLGFVQAVDGEKDPHNMVVIFSCWPTVVNQFDLEPFTEDVFEAMACYFPIDFNPPRGSVGGVTKEELVLGLRNCLSCHAQFAPLALPLFLEKLDSDLDDAKIDSCLTLTQCLTKYSPRQIEPHLEELWNLLKKEIMGIRLNYNQTVVDCCLKVLTSITERLDENKTVLEKWLDNIWQDAGRHLRDVELNLMTTSVNILASLTLSGKPYPFSYVLDKAVPVLAEVYSNCAEGDKKVLVLQSIEQLLQKSSLLEGQVEKPAWYESFLFMSNSALTEETNESLRNAGCCALTSGRFLLKIEHAEQIYAQIFKNIIGGQNLSTEQLQLMGVCAMMTSRPTEKDLEILYEKRTDWPQNVLDALAILYQNQHLARAHQQLITKKLLSDPDSFLWTVALLQKLQDFHKELSFLSNEKDTLEMIVEQATTNDANLNERGKQEVANLVASITKHYGPEDCPFMEEMLVNILQKRNFYIVEAILCYAQPSVLENLKSIYKELFSSHHDENKSSIEQLGKMCAVVLKKSSNRDELASKWLNDTENAEVNGQIVTMTAWMSKGLVLSMYPKIRNWVGRLIEYLKTDYADATADGFSLICSRPEDFFEATKSHTGLGRQKFFHLTKPDLVKGYNEGTNQGAHLKALICQLPHVPKFSISKELSSLLPLMSSGLKATEENLLMATLTSLQDLVKAEDFGPFLPTFLPLWLQLANDTSKSMHVRIEAIKCVRNAALKTEPKELNLHKKSVLKNLDPALDDRKRLVRQAAVAAKNEWCLAA